MADFQDTYDQSANRQHTLWLMRHENDLMLCERNKTEDSQFYAHVDTIAMIAIRRAELLHMIPR